MKKKSLKNLLIASSLSAVVGFGIYSYACADDYWSYSSTSSFTPEAFVDASYQPLFFAPYERFYNNAYLYNANLFNESVVDEWYNYLDHKVNKETLSAYILDSGNKEILPVNDLYASLKKKRTKVGDFDLSSVKIQNFITFLYYAKQIDKYSSQTYNYWDYEDHINIPAPDNLVNELVSFYSKMSKKDQFFANRMWFQVLKAMFYSDDREQVINYFNDTEKKQIKNTLYYRGLAYVAGAYYQVGNYVMSNLYYAEVYNAEPKLRQTALYNFRPMERGELEKVLNQTQDKSVKTAIWSIMGYYQDELTAMKEIYKIDPGSEHIDYLLTRWVNMQEQELNTFVEKSFKSKEEYFKAIKGKVNTSAYKWIREVSNKPNVLHNAVLWKMAVGYMEIFQGNYKDASKELEEAQALVKSNDKLLAEQIRLFKLINTVSQVKKIDKTVEADLLPELNWLYKELDTRDYSDPFRYEYAAQWVKKFLSAIYKEQGNIIMSEIVNSEGAPFYKKISNSREMEAFFLKKDKTPIEKLFLSMYSFNLSDIYESRAIHLFYQDKIDEAIVEMEKANPVSKTYSYSNEVYVTEYKNTQLFGNPFNGRIQDCNDCDHMAKQSVKYSKIDFLKKVKEMEDKVASGEDVFNNALLLGNAFYNTTYFGNARVFYQNNILGEYGSNSIGDDNKSFLLSMKLAQKYYDIARKYAVNNEQKAKLAYFSAKLERNEFYVKEYYNRPYFFGAWGDDIMFKKWKGFAELQSKYSDTKYYQEVINECGYFRKYLGMM
ncbi:hypothetical protein [Myroides injenensis]|uniref:hypothetical protein n=1 Tax=Myroides injenensis TaxID=1183151 RepID=UPI0002898D2B|nr:hypothetical protein [Myroides injenensis]